MILRLLSRLGITVSVSVEQQNLNALRLKEEFAEMKKEFEAWLPKYMDDYFQKWKTRQEDTVNPQKEIEMIYSAASDSVEFNPGKHNLVTLNELKVMVIDNLRKLQGLSLRSEPGYSCWRYDSNLVPVWERFHGDVTRAMETDPRTLEYRAIDQVRVDRGQELIGKHRRVLLAIDLLKINNMNKQFDLAPSLPMQNSSSENAIEYRSSLSHRESGTYFGE